MTEQTTASRTPVIAPSQALEFLTRAGEVLAASLDYEETLTQVAQLAVPDVADWCAVYVSSGDDSGREITSVHPDAEIEATLREIRRTRRETGAGSETLQVMETGKSLLASDVRQVGLDELRDEQRERIERLGPRAYMIVPLLARGRVIGALTLLSAREGRHYTPADLRFAETLAVRCAFAIDNARLYDAAVRTQGMLDATFSAVPVGLALLDTEARYVRVNDTLAAMNNASAADHVGRTPEDVLGAGARPVVELLRQIVATGEPLLGQEISGELEGAERHFVNSYSPVRGGDDEMLGIVVTVVEVSEHRALLDAERDARRRAHFLAEAGAALDRSLDYEETLANVARIAVPEIADWCAVAILDSEGVLRDVAAAHADPAKEEVARELRRRFPTPPDAASGTAAVARSGQTEFIPEITDAMLVATITDPEQLRLLRELELRSVIIAPLSARGRTLGTLTLANAESGRLFDESDREFADDLARRAGLAIDNARLYTERSRIAHTLQAGLLPARLPEIPGAYVAARYRAAGELNEVGGDFYDVFERDDGSWVLVVGDVSGKGAGAAAITALARYTLRATGRETSRPSEALARLNGAMLIDGVAHFATVVLAQARAAAGGRMKVEFALGGHPPPVVIRAGGEVDAPGEFGGLLGIYPDPHLVDTTVTLDPGDTLLLYTDGVIEGGPRGAPIGEEGLADFVRPLAGRPPDEIVAAVEEFVVDAQDGEPRDDIALLALQVPAGGDRSPDA